MLSAPGVTFDSTSEMRRHCINGVWNILYMNNLIKFPHVIAKIDYGIQLTKAFPRPKTLCVTTKLKAFNKSCLVHWISEHKEVRWQTIVL